MTKEKSPTGPATGPVAKSRQSLAEVRAALQREESRVAAMMELGRSLTAVTDLDALLHLVVEKITELMEADRTSIFLLDEQRSEIWSKVAEGDDMKEIRVPLGKGICGWVAETGKTINIKDAYQDDRFNPAVDRDTGYRTTSLLCAPMRGKQGQVLGVIESMNKHQGHFSAEDERLLEAVSSQAAVAIENAQLVLGILAKNIELVEAQEMLARKVAELDVLFQLEKEISWGLNADEMLHRLLIKAMELVECEAGSVALLAEDGEELRFSVAVGEKAEEVRKLRLPGGTGVAGWVVQHGQSALVVDASKDARHLGEIEREIGFSVSDILAVPLVAAGEVIGAVEFLNKKGGTFDANDEKLATVIAGQAVAAIETGRRREASDKENRLSAIGQALSGVIHDFRTPMTIISGYVQLMAMEDDEAVRDEQSETVLKQFDFINDMTKELLAFARGESSLLLRQVFTDRLLGEMKDLLQKELEAVGVKLEVNDTYCGPLRVDESKLRRLIYNITRNARQALAQGGEFSISVEEKDGQVQFEFADNGPGIPLEIRKNLFESFVTSGKAEGTGLGLAMVKKIVDEHQGSIVVESPEGGGARFLVSLPKRLESS